MNAMQQTEREKWQSLANATGQKLVRFYTSYAYSERTVAEFDCDRTVQLLTSDFRDSILAATERTSLEKAAPKMAATLGAIIADSVFESVCQFIGDEPQWLKDAREALKKAGMIE